MSSYKKEGHSNIFNFGIQKVLKSKSSVKQTLMLVQLSGDMLALMLLEDDILICSKTYCMPHDQSIKKQQQKVASYEYNLFKKKLLEKTLKSFDGVDLYSSKTK